jgi:hypothetical protein
MRSIATIVATMSTTDTAIFHAGTPPYATRASITIGAVGGRNEPTNAAVESGERAASIAKKYATSDVSLTVPARRGGVLALVMPIPPATVNFHGNATVRPAGSPEVGPLLDELGSLLPADRRASAAIIEIVTEGEFVTYGIDVSLTRMRDPAAARARVPVS